MNGSGAVLVVGSGPAAVAAIEAYRENGGTSEVRMLAAESRLPYERPALSKEYLRGEVGREEIALREGGWAREHGVAVELDSPVVSLDPGAGTVGLRDGRTLGFESLLLATGGRPAMPDVERPRGARFAGLRTPADSERVAGWAAEGLRIVVVGSGFIGCEAAASAASAGARVTLVAAEAAPQLERLGAFASERIGDWLDTEGVERIGGASLEAVHGSAEELEVRLDGAAPVACDAVLVAVGVRRNVELAEQGGLETATGILTDPSLRTSAERIWAAGDVAEALNPLRGERVLVEHWGEALAQGAVAGAGMAGAERIWDAVPGFWSTIGSHTLKFQGWGEGFDEARPLDAGTGGAFGVEYLSEGRLVGVLSHDLDELYESAEARIGAA